MLAVQLQPGTVFLNSVTGDLQFEIVIRLNDDSLVGPMTIIAPASYSQNQMAQHVFSEARRVQAQADALAAGLIPDARYASFEGSFVNVPTV